MAGWIYTGENLINFIGFMTDFNMHSTGMSDIHLLLPLLGLAPSFRPLPSDPDVVLMGVQQKELVPYCDSSSFKSWQPTTEILSTPRGQWIACEPSATLVTAVPQTAHPDSEKSIRFHFFPFLWNQLYSFFVGPIIIYPQPNTARSLYHHAYGPKFTPYLPASLTPCLCWSAKAALLVSKDERRPDAAGLWK